MSASRYSLLEALAAALNSNDLDRAKELNALARFIDQTFLDPNTNIEQVLRAEKDALDHQLAVQQGKVPAPERPYMANDGLDPNWEHTNVHVTEGANHG